MRTADFDYELPEELIAAYPPQHRREARLMVVERESGAITHAQFSQLGQWISREDLLVLNNSRVLPAYLETEDQRLTALLVEETSPRHWTALVKPGKHARPGTRLRFVNRRTGVAVEAEVLKTLETGERVFRFFSEVDLEQLGEMPLPPYILERRRALSEARAELPAVDDRERYQTVYAKKAGSVAAPTAGLHFDAEFLAQFSHAFVTLHVGLGTFRPVKVEELRDHEMHEERFEVPEGLAARAATARRLVAVGTTTARVLESVPDLLPRRGRTRIFIHPPYRFKRVQALVTNFHLPRSTLLMLVSAFAGHGLMREAYRQAVEQRYRFFSYGDAMLLL